MHEMGIITQIVKIATSSIPDDMENAQVERVNMKVGRLSAVVVESLRFWFEIVARDTPLSGAELNIEEIPVVVRCNKCNKEWTVDRPVFICKECNGGSIEILSGRELDIVSIEMANNEQPKNKNA